MKLLYCKECHDITALVKQTERSCLCGKSKGQYTHDELNVTVSGPCEVLGFQNRSFTKALQNKKQDWGTPFEAFVIPTNARTVTRV